MKYRVDFYDMFDGWLGGILDNPHEFDDLNEAIKLRDKRNSELDDNNKRAGEHFGVIDLEQNVERFCPRNDPSWPK